MYPRFALPKLTTSEEFGYMLSFTVGWIVQSWLPEFLLCTSSAINQSLHPKAQKIGLIETILAISLITQEIQELANLFAL